MSKNISLFKSYLDTDTPAYKGGKSKDEISFDGPIYKLSSNENPIGASPKAIAAIQANINNLSEYPDNTDLRLRTALSAFYKNELTPDQFVTANSGVGIIELIVHAFLGEGLECIACNPAFLPYISFPTKVGAIIRDVPLLDHDYNLDIDGIVKNINDSTRVIWLCSPNNPTGTYLPKQDIDKLLAQVPEHVVVILDEVYFQFATAEDYTTSLPYVLEGKNVIGVNSFSKAYGLAGLRIGYAYSTPKIGRYLSKLQRPFYINTLATEAAMAALTDDEFLELTVRTVNEGKAYLYPELDKLGITYWKSQANFFTIKPAMDPKLFEEKMQSFGVMVRPVGNFGAPGCVRITIGKQEANEAVIHAMKNIL
ncbi:MAG: histidinol-phosphate aminotransferase [Granulosicoccus sp.]|jgi:histidinol-phosphate aminotransferase